MSTVDRGMFQMWIYGSFLTRLSTEECSHCSPPTERSALIVQRCRRPVRPETACASQRASKTMEWPEAEVAPRVYAMAWEEPDPIDIIRGTFSIYNTFNYVLIDPNYIYPYICIIPPVERGYR